MSCPDSSAVSRRADEKGRHLFIGATANGGQACFGIKRIFVHEDVYDAVRDELVALAKAAKVGDPLHPDIFMGPMQNKALQDKLGYVSTWSLIITMQPECKLIYGNCRCT